MRNAGVRSSTPSMTAAEIKELSVTYESLSWRNLDALKLMCTAIFPVKYQDNVFTQCQRFEDLTQLAYHDGTLVGAICVRLEKMRDGTRPKMYIMILGVLAPYRGMRVGSRLLERCLAAVAQYPEVCEAYLHVQSCNDEAVDFYRKFGFEVKETVENYYKRLEPPHAVVLAKKIGAVVATRVND